MVATRTVRLEDEAEAALRFGHLTAPRVQRTGSTRDHLCRHPQLGFLPPLVGINIFLALYTPQASRARSVSRRAVRRIAECSWLRR